MVLVGCATMPPPTAQRPAPPIDRAAEEAAKREQLAQATRRFYEAHPILRGREKCVARAVDKLPNGGTFDDLARVAISLCVPPPPPLENQTAWIRASTGSDGHSVFIDLSRIEVREGHQITFWELDEFFDDETDFILARVVADCDRKLFAPFQTVNIISGRYGETSPAPIIWQSVLPNTQGEAVLNAACAARAELTKPTARAEPQARPAPRPVRESADDDPSI
jgi:hypothetical protein